MIRRMSKIIFVVMMLWVLFFSFHPVVFAESKDKLNVLIPDEQQMGIVPGEKTLDYKAFAPENYTWDLGYDLIEWEGWTPKFHNPFPVFLDGLANLLFLMNVFLVRLSIFLMQLGFHTDLVNEQVSLILPMVNGLRISLFDRFLPYILVFLAAWMVKVGYWNNQTTRLTSGTIGSIVILICGLWFMSHTGQSIRFVSQTMDKLTLVTMGSLAAPYQTVTGDQTLNHNVLSAADQQLLTTSNRIWKLFVDRPWTIGEFGREDASEVTMTEEEVSEIQKRASEEDISMSVLTGEPWSHAMRQYSFGMPQRDILRKVLGSPKIDHGNHADLPDYLWGGSAGIRCVVALLSLLATFCLLLFVGAVSLILVIAQELALAVILISPVVFLLGIFPERGVSITRKWLGWLIGTLGTKVVYGFYFGFTLLLADIVARGTGILMIQQIFVGLLFFCAFLYRKRILQTLLGLVHAPTPHDMYQTTKHEVSRHWNDTKDSWDHAKHKSIESWNQVKNKSKAWISKWKKRT